MSNHRQQKKKKKERKKQQRSYVSNLDKAINKKVKRYMWIYDMRSKILKINRKKVSVKSIVTLRLAQKWCIDRIQFLGKLLKISPPKYKIDVYVFRNQTIAYTRNWSSLLSLITCLRFFKFIDKILCNDKQMLTHLITVCFILLVILYFLLSRDFFPSFLLL